jgi:hypothetical protein
MKGTQNIFNTLEVLAKYFKMSLNVIKTLKVYFIQ